MAGGVGRVFEKAQVLNILSVTLDGLNVIVCDRQGKEMLPREQSDMRAKSPLVN